MVKNNTILKQSKLEGVENFIMKLVPPQALLSRTHYMKDAPPRKYFSTDNSLKMVSVLYQMCFDNIVIQYLNKKFENDLTKNVSTNHIHIQINVYNLTSTYFYFNSRISNILLKYDVNKAWACKALTISSTTKA